MLERTAHYRDELAYDGEARRGPVLRVLGAALRHPGRTLATLIFVGAAGAIFANAAFFQTGEHPSPFFATREDAPTVPAAADAQAQTPAPVATPPAADEIGRLVEVTAVGAPTVPATAASATVVEVQQLLLAQGYDPGIVDGLFGTRTQTAIRAYQTAWGLTATGEITEALLTQLRSTAPNPASPTAIMPTEELRLLAIQTALNQIGYGPIEANGEMTPETTAAIRAFQLEYGLTPNGTVDQNLIDRMVAIGALEPF